MELLLAKIIILKNGKFKWNILKRKRTVNSSHNIVWSLDKFPSDTQYCLAQPVTGALDQRVITFSLEEGNNTL